jgi:DtxR family Mn-dependent transcriptional regulator
VLSSSLEEFLITIYKMSEERTELKSTEVARTIDAPLQKTIQALQRMHYQKYIIYSPYQPHSGHHCNYDHSWCKGSYWQCNIL